MNARDLLGFVIADARDWARGRSWLWRAPLLLYLAVVGLKHLRDPEYGSLMFGGVTFGIHELGHVIFGPFGEFLGFAGGSITQVVAPIAAGAVLLLYRKDGEPQRDWFGVAVALAWLGFSLFNLATYIGDAREQSLPLLGLSDEPQHDWAYLLGEMGMLKLDGFFAFLTRVAAFASWATSLVFGGWLLNVMRTS